MRYCTPCRTNVLQISEPNNLYETDLIKQWLLITPGSVFISMDQMLITIINPGKLNKNEGPDIKDAILIIDGEMKSGNIECHINTSDWFKHRHHQNINYDTVILHVVRKAPNNANQPNIPTLILEDTGFYSNDCILTGNNKRENILNVIRGYSHRHWQNKLNEYFGYHDNYSLLNQKLIKNSLSILGVGGNREQFLTLAKSINYELIGDYSIADIEVYLNTQSVILNIDWKKRGIRPAQQPQHRIKLAAEIIKYISTENYNKNFTHTDIKKDFIFNCPSAKGKGIQSELLGNVLIPYFASKALFGRDNRLYDTYYSMWKSLKLPIAYRKYQNRFNNIIPDSVLKSFPILQGLIEIDIEWCQNKFCKFCPLKQTNDY